MEYSGGGKVSASVGSVSSTVKEGTDAALGQLKVSNRTELAASAATTSTGNIYVTNHSVKH